MKADSTSQLIKNLAAQVETPSESSRWRSYYVLTCLVTFTLMGLVTLVAHFLKPDMVKFPENPFAFVYLAGAIMWLALFLILARLAFISAVPFAPAQRLRPIFVAVIAALAALVLAQETLVQIVSSVGSEFDWSRGPCGIFIFSLGLCCGSISLISFGRAASINKRKSGALTLAASGAAASFFMHLICRFENGAHVLLWHVLPILLITLLGAASAALLIREKKLKII